MKLHRIHAFFLRHLYPLKRDFDLLSDMLYWPLVDTLLWGITSQWLVESSGATHILASILTALVLWNVIWRSQSEVARNLMDEIWNNNLVNLFSTPLSITEWVVGVLLLSLIKTSLTLAVIIPVMLFLYGVNVLALGSWMPVFFVSAVITGWWVGFISAGIVLRYGPKAQTVIWTLPAVLLPFSAIYFPLARLPVAIQAISSLLPTTYVFEAMRALLQGSGVSVALLAASFGLNLIYLGLAVGFFIRSFSYSRTLGLGRFD